MLRVLLALPLSLILASVVPAQSAVSAQSPPYKQLFVFGDSYSDTGAGFLYADGPTAVAYMADRLHIPFTYYGAADSAGKSLNFAVSGARTGDEPGLRQGPHALFRLGMKNQVEQFADLVRKGKARFDSAETLFFLAGGLNDRGTPTGYTRTNIEEQIETLYALGARRFMVALLPTHIPQFASAGLEFNPELSRIPSDERSRHPDIRIALSHWGEFFDQVFTNINQFGLTNTTEACAGRPTLTAPIHACSSPSTYFFYYEAHPSTATHRAVGELLYREALTQAP